MQYFSRSTLLLIALACAVFFVGLGSTRLWDEDEGYFASAAAEMYARGDWIVPYFNGEMFGHKPPLMYWGMGLGFAIFGVNEVGARFFSAAFGVATTLLVYQFGRRLFNDRAGFYAAVAAATALGFNIISRAATPDGFLTFFSTLAIYIFAVNGFARQAPVEGRTNDPWPGSWSVFARIYAVLGLGVLTKGPIGLFFPMAVIGLFLLCMTPLRRWGKHANFSVRLRERLRPFGPVNFVTTVMHMQPLTAIGMVLLVAGWWYVAVGVQTDGRFLEEFFGVHHFTRFNSAMDNHSGPIYYYFVSVLVGMFPFSIFAAPALLLWYRGLQTDSATRPALVLIACWVGVYLGIFSLAGTKLPNYVLPAYPALALLAGWFVDAWLRAPSAVPNWMMRIVWSAPLLVGFVLLVLLPCSGILEFGGRTLLDRAKLSREVQQDLIWLGLLGIPCVVGGAIALIAAHRGRFEAAAQGVVVMGVANLLVFWSYGAPRIDRFQSPQDLAQQVLQQENGAAVTLGQHGFFRPSMVFYTHQRIDSYDTIGSAVDFLAHDGSRLITIDTHYKRLKKRLPPDIEVLAEKPRFPKAGRILVLGRKAAEEDSDGRVARKIRP